MGYVVHRTLTILLLGVPSADSLDGRIGGRLEASKSLAA
jgi:hypothetical protein